MSDKETDQEFSARMAELPFAEQDRPHLVRQIDAPANSDAAGNRTIGIPDYWRVNR